MLTLSEAARIVRCKPQTLVRAIKAGVAPGRLLSPGGRSWRIPRAALLDWLAGREPQSAEAEPGERE